MSSRQAAVELINAEGFTRGAELGVWRGARAWEILDNCPGIESLLLVDPWEEARNRFPLREWEQAPARMPQGVYHCTMGEPHADQAELDRMAAKVIDTAAAYGPSRVTVHRIAAERLVPEIQDASIDFVLIDGVHLPGWIRAMRWAWTRTLRAGGVVAGDGADDAVLLPAILEPVAGLGGVVVLGDFWWQRRQPMAEMAGIDHP